MLGPQLEVFWRVALHLRGDELVDVDVEDAGVLAHLLIDHIVFGAV